MLESIRLIDFSFYRNILQNRRFSVVSLTHTLTHVYDMLNLSLIPVFLGEFGLSTLQAGMLSTVFLVAGMFGSISTGFLLNRFGDKRVMMGSLLMMGVFSVLISRANDYRVLMVELFLLYFVSRLYCPPALSIISESGDAVENRGKTVGLHVSMVQLGVALGPIGLGLLMRAYNWRLAYLVLAFPLFLSIWSVSRLEIASSKKIVVEEAQNAVKSNGLLPDFLTSSFLMTLIALGFNAVGLESVQTFFTTYLTTAKGLSTSLSSIVFGLKGIGLIGVSLGGILSDRYGEKKWISVCWLGAIISLLGISYAPTMSLLIVFYVLYNLFNYGVIASTISLVARLTSKNKRSSGYTVYFVAKGIMSAFSPIVAGMIIDVFGVWYVFPFALIAFIVAILLIQKAL